MKQNRKLTFCFRTYPNDLRFVNAIARIKKSNTVVWPDPNTAGRVPGQASVAEAKEIVAQAKKHGCRITDANFAVHPGPPKRWVLQLRNFIPFKGEGPHSVRA